MSPVVIVLIVVAVGVGAFLAMKNKQDSGPKAPTVLPATPVAAPAKKLHWLVKQTGEGEQVAWHIGQRRVTAGRGPTNFVQITDPRASRKQCAFAPDGDDLKITDMTSQNGTFVNGTVVTTKTLEDGDVVKLADTEFTYYREGTFDGNEGLGRKEAGKGTLQTTKVHRDLGKAAKADMMLEAMGGDHEKAAAAMEMSVEEFRALVE